MLRPTFIGGLALASALCLPGVANAATITPAEAAGYGAGWLGRSLDDTGYIASLSGPDYNTTALAVLALVAAEVGEAQAAAATTYLFANVDAYVKDGSDDRPAALATLILVGHARGVDVSALVTRLLATKQTTGADAGLFGVQDATYDGTYRQALSLLALAAVGQTDADAVAWLKNEQCADGGWMGNNPDPSAACPAFDFNTFVGEDSNGTALAVQALVALGETPAHDPFEFLFDAQNEDGGFAFIPGFDSDANSTALAVQALIAAGEDLADWEAPDGTPYSFLLGLQLDSGAFTFQGGTVANAFATVQVVPALAGKAFPLAPAELSTDLPAFPVEVVDTPESPKPATGPIRVVDPAPVRELPATGTDGLALGLALISSGLVLLGGARVARRMG